MVVVRVAHLDSRLWFLQVGKGTLRGGGDRVNSSKSIETSAPRATKFLPGHDREEEMRRVLGRDSSPRGLTINLLCGLCTAADIYISLGDFRTPEDSMVSTQQITKGLYLPNTSKPRQRIIKMKRLTCSTAVSSADTAIDTYTEAHRVMQQRSHNKLTNQPYIDDKRR